MKPIWKYGWFWISAIMLIVAVARVFYADTVDTFVYLTVMIAAAFFVFVLWRYFVERKKFLDKIDNEEIVGIGA